MPEIDPEKIIEFCEMYDRTIYIWKANGAFVTFNERGVVDHDDTTFEGIKKKLQAAERRQLKARKITLPCVTGDNEIIFITGINVRTFMASVEPDESAVRIHDVSRHTPVYAHHEHVRSLIQERDVLEKALRDVRAELSEYRIELRRYDEKNPDGVTAEQYSRIIDALTYEHRTKTKLAEERALMMSLPI